MKKVVLYARSLFELVGLAASIQSASRLAIRTSGAVKITIEPASPEHSRQPLFAVPPSPPDFSCAAAARIYE